ncbi:hypothetical protein ILUMI_11019, partial [Ignelater luminosus]
MEETQTTRTNGPPITKDAIEKSIRRIKNSKAVGPNEIPIEILKLMAENHLDITEELFIAYCLFNLFSEELFKEVLYDIIEGISINGRPDNNFRYADGTVLVADSKDGRQILVNLTMQACENYGITLHTRKTKVLIVSKNNIDDRKTYADGTPLER